jgi:hypothetical protein
MTLEEEVPAVVVVRVGTPEAALEHEIRVLVRLRLLGLDVRAERRDERLPVGLIAVVGDHAVGVLELRGALRQDDFLELRREPVRRRVTDRLLVRARHVGEIEVVPPTRRSDRKDDRRAGYQADRGRTFPESHPSPPLRVPPAGAGPNEATLRRPCAPMGNRRVSDW